MYSSFEVGGVSVRWDHSGGAKLPVSLLSGGLQGSR